MVYSLIIGLFLGSFINYLVNQISNKFKNEKIEFTFIDLLPLYFKKESLNLNKLAIELMTALVTCLLFFKLQISMEFFLTLFFFCLLILLSFIDLKYKAVPDFVLLALFLLSFFISSTSILEAFKNAFLISGAFVLLNFLLTFYVQNIKSKLLKDESLKNQEALGEGDIPVFASIAIVLGLKSSIIAIFLSSFFAIIPAIYLKYKKQDIQTPFIPFISLGFFAEYFLQISKVLF